MDKVVDQKDKNLEFQAEKSAGFGLFLLAVGLLVLFLSVGLPLITIDGLNSITMLIKCFITFIVNGFFLWCWLSTYYKFDNKTLIVKCGPFRWLLPIKEIKSIRLNQNTFGGIIKPTLSWKCIEIDYSDNKTISISPKNQDRFLDILKDINNEISIK